VAAGLPAGVARFLRAKLWFHGAFRSKDTRTIGKTLALLEEVPPRHRQLEWLDMVAGCHERLGDWKAYARVFPRLFTATEPTWRAAPLRTMLANAARRRDWRTYDRWRPEWDRLPPARHMCECHKNLVANTDGLRAAAAGRWDETPGHLAAAADVAGCPHLNSGGLRLDLVQLLVRRRRHRDACRAYLDRAAQFGSPRGLAALRRALAQ
jgi:hypothetical protein